jgi:hypothetical protein
MPWHRSFPCRSLTLRSLLCWLTSLKLYGLHHDTRLRVSSLYRLALYFFVSSTGVNLVECGGLSKSVWKIRLTGDDKWHCRLMHAGLVVMIFCEPCFNAPNNINFLHIKRLVHARICSNESSSLCFVPTLRSESGKGAVEQAHAGMLADLCQLSEKPDLRPKMSFSLRRLVVEA